MRHIAVHFGQDAQSRHERSLWIWIHVNMYYIYTCIHVRRIAVYFGHDAVTNTCIQHHDVYGSTRTVDSRRKLEEVREPNTNARKISLVTSVALILGDDCTGWRRLIGSLIFIGHFWQKWPIFSGSLWKMMCNLGDPMSLRHPIAYMKEYRVLGRPGLKQRC